MRRTELEHIIRAASAITNQYEMVIIGSQSILGLCLSRRPRWWSRWRQMFTRFSVQSWLT